jgi:dTDP-L-rhamnose 4-epimerase
MAEMLVDIAGKRLKPEIVDQYRKGDIRHCYADITQAEGLGYQPSISIYEGLQHLYNWSCQVEAIDQVESAHMELVSRGLVGR